MKSSFLQLRLAGLALLLVGCVPTSVGRFPTSNPANPDAPEAAYVAPVSLLMAGTNYGMAPEAEKPTAPRHHQGMGREMEQGQPMRHEQPNQSHNAPQSAP